MSKHMVCPGDRGCSEVCPHVGLHSKRSSCTKCRCGKKILTCRPYEKDNMKLAIREAVDIARGTYE